MTLNRRILSRLLRVNALAACWLLFSSACFAHPMGNFSINHYASIRIEQDFIEIRYLIDMAEIPTFQEIQQFGLVTNPKDASARNYVSKQSEALRTNLILTLNRRAVPLRTESAEVIFPPGAAGLSTMKMAMRYRATILPQDHSQATGGDFALYYRDDNFPSRVGWKEVVASAGPRVMIVNTSVPVKDRSAGLSNYPTDLLKSPPLDLEARASFRWDPTASPAETLRAPDPSLQSNQQTTPQNRFTQLMTANQSGTWFLVVAAAIAAALGALHALEPGHGKTIVAAYLVGSQGTAYHAFLLGLIVTASHTAGVYALGAVTLYASRYIVPEQLYPWLGSISGLLIAALGSYLFLQRYAGGDIGHSHGPGGHHHHMHDDDHDHAHAREHSHDAPGHHGHRHDEIRGEVSYRQLLALGITGGVVPCPAALVVLLSAVALNRVGFGLFLIVAFSVGLATVLIAVGMLMVYARTFMARFRSDGPLITRWLPLTSAAVITFLVLSIAIRSLITAGILQIRV
jgi:ABC-type nickel/cobalt efflux system permease component RcnA